MAEHYITEIRQLQPRGPYRIGGASFGGMVAFEMARRLRQEGHEVGLVALFDTHGPGYPQFRQGITHWHKLFFRHWERLDYHARNLLLLDNRGRIDYLGQKLAKAKHMLRLTIKRSRKRVLRRWHELLGNSLPADLVRTQNAILHALQSYKPSFYDGEITVFRATRQPMGVIANETLGWAPYAREVRVIDVPGYHTGIILEPHVRFMADMLRAGLDREIDPSDAAPADPARAPGVASAAIA
jgi:thioesterase domain-containing protein